VLGLSFYRWQGWTGLGMPMIAEGGLLVPVPVFAKVDGIHAVVLQLRIYALYYLNKRVLLLMSAAFLASSATSATLMGIVLSKIKGTTLSLLTFVTELAIFSFPVIPIPGFPFCVASNISHDFYAFWIPILAFETFLFTLALFRFLKYPHSPSTAHLYVIQLFRVLIRDSILYFSM
jgi:hypothetical protein